MNSAVSLLFGYFEETERGFMIFRGRAHATTNAGVREKVFQRAHEFEQGKDPERKGVAVIVDLDSVDGFFGGARIEMRR